MKPTPLGSPCHPPLSQMLPRCVLLSRLQVLLHWVTKVELRRQGEGGWAKPTPLESP